MICVNDVVLYGNDGVCHVIGVTTRKIGGIPEKYYVLRPVSQGTTTIYVPVNNETLVSRMQRLLSLDEAIELIRSVSEEETIWIEDDTKRRFAYEKILEVGDRREIFKLIKTLSLRAQEYKGSKRKMHTADEKLMKEAEKRLYDEFAQVLHIEPEEVLPFIFRTIGESADVKQA